MKFFSFVLLIFIFSILNVYCVKTIGECNLDGLNEWFLDNGGKLDKIKIDVVDSQNERAIYATEDIKKGHVVMEIPKSIILSTDMTEKPGLYEDMNKIEKYSGNKYTKTSRSKLSLVLLNERFQQENSFWDQYIDCLPQNINSPIYYSEAVAHKIQKTYLLKITKERQKFIEDTYAVFFKNALSRLSFDDEDDIPAYPKDVFNKEAWTWAISMITSRAFVLPESFIKESTYSDVDSVEIAFRSKERGEPENEIISALIPFADFFNAPFNKNNKLVEARFEGNKIQYYVTDDIEKGEQIFMKYGDVYTYSVAEVLLNYGFILVNDDFNNHITYFKSPLKSKTTNYEEKIAIVEKYASKIFQNEKEKNLFFDSNQISIKKAFPSTLLWLIRINLLTSDELDNIDKYHNNIMGYEDPIFFDDEDQTVNLSLPPFNEKNEATAVRGASLLLNQNLLKYGSTIDVDKKELESITNMINGAGVNPPITTIQLYIYIIQEKQLYISAIDLLSRLNTSSDMDRMKSYVEHLV